MNSEINQSERASALNKSMYSQMRKTSSLSKPATPITSGQSPTNTTFQSQNISEDEFSRDLKEARAMNYSPKLNNENKVEERK